MGILHDLPPRLAANLFPSVESRGTGDGIYLTFDDGPDPQMTPKFLQVLAALNCHATFFLTGSQAELFPETVRHIVGAGHSVGSHGYDHSSHLGMTSADIYLDMKRSCEAIGKATGTEPRLFRPPYGRIGWGTLKAARELHLKTILWSLSARDWRPGDPGQLTATITKRAGKGDIVLLHDSGPGSETTLAALPGIVGGIRAKGLKIISFDVKS